MTQYSYSQLEGIWIANGGNKAAAPIAAAIAMAESGGDSNATNHNTNGSTDRGLWQINSVWGSLSTFDPNANTKAAIQISHNGSNWNPWVTFTTGAYKKFLQGNVPPSSSGSPSSGGGSNAGLIGNLLGLPSQVTDFFGAADDFIKAAMWLVNPGHWFRIGAFFAGTVLLLFGVYLLAKTNGFELPKSPPVMPIPVPV